MYYWVILMHKIFHCFFSSLFYCTYTCITCCMNLCYDILQAILLEIMTTHFLLLLFWFWEKNSHLVWNLQIYLKIGIIFSHTCLFTCDVSSTKYHMSQVSRTPYSTQYRGIFHRSKIEILRQFKVKNLFA